MIRSSVTLLLVFLLYQPLVSYAADLHSVTGVTYHPTEWSDGDSFRVKFPDGQEHTIRLYGADCIEWHITDQSDARRLRAQRSYFGISDYGDSAKASIQLAKIQGEAAAKALDQLLSAPFTVHTSFADGRGDGRYKRIYAFIETADGKDLATELVKRGLARAFGVYRSTPAGASRTEYIQHLRDTELVAARSGKGVWNYTDWENLTKERKIQRAEEAEARLAMGTSPPDELLDPNTASKDQLARIPGIGDTTAHRIIEARPFSSVDDLERVNGIGSKTLEKLRPYFQ